MSSTIGPNDTVSAAGTMSSQAARAVRIAALEVHTQAAPARMLLEWWRLELEHQATELCYEKSWPWQKTMLSVQWKRATSLRQIAMHCLGHLRCMSITGLLLVRAPWMGTRETSKRTATVLISNSHGQQLPPAGDGHHSQASKGKQMPLELINNCHPVMVTYCPW